MTIYNVEERGLFTVQELERVGSQLKERKALGIDGIPYEMLKVARHPKLLLDVPNEWMSQKKNLLRRLEETKLQSFDKMRQASKGFLVFQTAVSIRHNE